ncbi:hypothetical protein GF373_00715, partial [bacterium]|nr:hypothetical protein [bacterium]
VALDDQVLATAMMLCLADKIETKQGDPRLDITDLSNRKKVISYGNRLFCDEEKENDIEYLVHRWGSSKLYRGYFLDYQQFLKRPNTVAKKYSREKNKNDIVIIHCDISKFYDKVSPKLLFTKTCEFIKDPYFKQLFKKLFHWNWEKNDWSRKYFNNNQCEVISLPQGLVASGFFANIVLLDFDNYVKNKFTEQS